MSVDNFHYSSHSLLRLIPSSVTFPYPSHSLLRLIPSSLSFPPPSHSLLRLIPSSVTFPYPSHSLLRHIPLSVSFPHPSHSLLRLIPSSVSFLPPSLSTAGAQARGGWECAMLRLCEIPFCPFCVSKCVTMKRPVFCIEEIRATAYRRYIHCASYTMALNIMHCLSHPKLSAGFFQRNES
jgi:hypothetical protein